MKLLTKDLRLINIEREIALTVVGNRGFRPVWGQTHDVVKLGVNVAVKALLNDMVEASGWKGLDLF